MNSKLTLLLIPFLMLTACKHLMKKEISEPEKVVIKLFETYPTDGPRKAIGTLMRSNKYISEQIADTVATKLERLTSGLGSYEGYEKIRERTYGEGITLLTYIVKYSRQPLRFNFKFYQPGTGWTIQNFSYEVEFLNELDESIRPYRLRENLEGN